MENSWSFPSIMAWSLLESLYIIILLWITTGMYLAYEGPLSNNWSHVAPFIYLFGEAWIPFFVLCVITLFIQIQYSGK